MINISDFQKINMNVGIIIDVKDNIKAKKKAYVIDIDFGDLGIKKSSAQITDLYTKEELIGKKIIAVTNFPSMKIGDVNSEVLILGVDTPKGVSLLTIDKDAKPGKRVY